MFIREVAKKLVRTTKRGGGGKGWTTKKKNNFFEAREKKTNKNVNTMLSGVVRALVVRRTIKKKPFCGFPIYNP